MEHSVISNDVLVSLRRIIQAIDLHSKSLVRRYGLTGPQLIILQEVAKISEISVGELSTAISLGQATVTGVLSRLEKRGLITRRKSQTDKRKVLVQITDEGQAILKETPSPLQETFLFNFERLHSWEQNMILASLQKIVMMMNAKNIDASPILAAGPIEDPNQPYK